jgi:hypothetical protein
MLGNGDGTFQAQLRVKGGGKSIVVSDINGDGAPDMVAVNGHGFSVSLGNWDETLQSPLFIAPSVRSRFINGSQSVAVADFNNDGFTDVITANSDAYELNPWPHVSIQLGNGNGTFQTEQRYGVYSDPRSVVVKDFNGDGFMDVVTANSDPGTFYNPKGSVSVLLGNGDGTFQPEQRFAVGTRPQSVAVADVNGDGLPDIITGNDFDSSILLHQ